MKLGLVSSILADLDFYEAIDAIAEAGYSCVELACWPCGTAERRYAGVTHLDVDSLNENSARQMLAYCHTRGVQISALCYYPNTMDGDLSKRAENIDHLKKVIQAAAELNIGLVTTFVGRDQNKTVEENLELFRKIWPPIVTFAQEHNVKIGIENCPMLFDETQWPGGQNLACTPEIWDRLFEIIPNANFGLNYDPSHFIWQQMDYIQPIYDYRDRIFHVHFKDIHVQPEKLARVGILAYPLQYMMPNLPGLGDVNWRKFICALEEIGYDGFACVEMEDRDYEGSLEAIKSGMKRSYDYIAELMHRKEN